MFIFNYILTFRQLVKCLLFFVMLLVGCNSSGTSFHPLIGAPGYNIISENDTISKKWADYLYGHLKERSKEKNIILLNEENEEYMTVKFVVDNSLEYDYCINCNPGYLVLKVRTEEVASWMVYQFLEQLSNNDSRFSGDDLPPSVLSFHSNCSDFDFSYRDPFFGPNLEDGQYSHIIGANSVDNDWGIWGHNLGTALSNKNNSVYAKHNGTIKYDQYCFSGDDIFQQLKEYIIDNFGNDPGYVQNFMIMPNDNTIVCDCSLCKANGNTEDSATPALSVLIRKLASTLPYHKFFTSAYMTTMQPPTDKWPENTGVMISTINIPKGVELKDQDEVISFTGILEKWKKYVPNIYIWDYAANFDDYLTPIPVLYGLKKHLKFYKSRGVKGVFLNASGYDYSPYDDLKTYVSSALMINCELPVDSLCREYLTQAYPKSGEALITYYLSLEERMKERNRPYNLYGGFRETLDTFLDKERFIGFYDSLGFLISVSEEEEKEKLEKLYTALTFTRLQIAYYDIDRVHGFADLDNKVLTVKPEIYNLLDRLSGYNNYKDLSNYKESDGSLKMYIDNWQNLCDAMPFQNQLIGEQIHALSSLDEEYKDISVLNDGILGFAGDYHQGWFINSHEYLQFKINTTNMKNAERVSLRFLVDRKHNIHPPEKVEIIKDKTIYTSISRIVRNKEGISQIVLADLNVDFSDCESVVLRIYQSDEYSGSIACDEIQIN